jgi:FkbM family methyltransferase
MAPGDWTLSPEDYVRVLYEVCLERPPDDAGLSAWTAQLRASGDPTALLKEFVSSEEYRNKRLPPAQRPHIRELASRAAAMLGRRPRIVDVGAQSLGVGTHPYSPLTEFAELDIVGFDPLSDRLDDRQRTEGDAGSLTLLPYAIGDGASHNLQINNDDATSGLFALNPALTAELNHLATLRTVRSERIQTRTLDDVLDTQPIDFLKLDVQGAELMILQHATASLQRTAVVHCEVHFSPLYLDVPLYPAIQDELAKHGFYLLDFAELCRYHYLDTPFPPSPDRLLWADAVFFREEPSDDQAIVQALIAAAVYGKGTLASHLLESIGR